MIQTSAVRLKFLTKAEVIFGLLWDICTTVQISKQHRNLEGAYVVHVRRVDPHAV
jgi:hypothetical protein